MVSDENQKFSQVEQDPMSEIKRKRLILDFVRIFWTRQIQILQIYLKW